MNAYNAIARDELLKTLAGPSGQQVLLLNAIKAKSELDTMPLFSVEVFG